MYLLKNNFAHLILEKRSLGLMIKLLPHDLVVTSSNCGNNFLQCKIRLHKIDSM